MDRHDEELLDCEAQRLREALASLGELMPTDRRRADRPTNEVSRDPDAPRQADDPDRQAHVHHFFGSFDWRLPGTPSDWAAQPSGLQTPQDGSPHMAGDQAQPNSKTAHDAGPAAQGDQISRRDVRSPLTADPNRTAALVSATPKVPKPPTAHEVLDGFQWD